MPRFACLDCGTITTQSRCPVCFQKKIASQPNFIRRKTTSQRGYDSSWQKIRLKVLAKHKFICYYCGTALVGSDATVDHLLPLSRGGTSEEKNLVASCRSCNSKKKNK
jgi:5-methylcytosine-specific restriction endonuclease McrA